MIHRNLIFQALRAAVIALTCLHVLGCDSVSESDEAAFELRITGIDTGELIETALLSDSMVVNVAELSTGNEATFRANSLRYEGRHDMPYDGRDVLLNLYVDRDGDIALLPSVSGGGSFQCGFPGQDVLEEFSGRIYAFTAAPTRRNDVQRSTLPYRASRIDCVSGSAMDAEYVDTLRIDPSIGVIPWNRLHTVGELSEMRLRVDLEPTGYEGRVLPIVLSRNVRVDDWSWYITLLEPSAERQNLYSASVLNDGTRIHVVLLTASAR